MKRIIVFFPALLLLAVAAFGAGKSDVADAVMKGNKTAVRALLQQKADVNAPQADGATALHWAVYADDLETVNLLIRAGANVKAANREGVTPLSLASLNGSAAMIDKLLEAGSDVNARGPAGETALMMAARNGNVDAIKVLLDRGAEVNAKEPLRESTALIWAVEQEHAAAAKLLAERGADVSVRTKGEGNARRAVGGAAAAPAGVVPVPAPAAAAGAAAAADDDTDEAAAPAGGGGLTPLVFAARQGTIETARVLLAAKADVNQTSNGGWTPLLTAVKNGYYKLAIFLLDNGAKVNMPNAQGWTPLYLAADNRDIAGGDYPTRKADMDDLEFIKVLLDRGADVNTRSGSNMEKRTVFTGAWLAEDGATPFLRASQAGDVTLMKLLLSRGADPTIATKKGTTALAAAAGIGWVEGITHEWSPQESVEAIKMLVDLGVDVNAVDSDGRRAIHGAAHKGRNEVVQILADHGALLDVKDKGSRDTRAGPLVGFGWLPLDYAEGLVRVGVQSAIPHPETAALLRKLMTERGNEVPPLGRNSTYSICLAQVCEPPK